MPRGESALRAPQEELGRGSERYTADDVIEKLEDSAELATVKSASKLEHLKAIEAKILASKKPGKKLHFNEARRLREIRRQIATEEGTTEPMRREVADTTDEPRLTVLDGGKTTGHSGVVTQDIVYGGPVNLKQILRDAEEGDVNARKKESGRKKEVAMRAKWNEPDAHQKEVLKKIGGKYTGTVDEYHKPTKAEQNEVELTEEDLEEVTDDTTNDESGVASPPPLPQVSTPRPHSKILDRAMDYDTATATGGLAGTSMRTGGVLRHYTGPRLGEPMPTKPELSDEEAVEMYLDQDVEKGNKSLLAEERAGFQKKYNALEARRNEISKMVARKEASPIDGIATVEQMAEVKRQIAEIDERKLEKTLDNLLHTELHLNHGDSAGVLLRDGDLIKGLYKKSWRGDANTLAEVASGLASIKADQLADLRRTKGFFKRLFSAITPEERQLNQESAALDDLINALAVYMSTPEKPMGAEANKFLRRTTMRK